jgi:hypothetical protein
MVEEVLDTAKLRMTLRDKRIFFAVLASLARSLIPFPLSAAREGEGEEQLRQKK